jgi:hypothetical protein
LTDGSTVANGAYDLQFALYDTATGSGQIGTTQSLAGVQVVNGIFTVSLDFGAGTFPGSSRFLEIRIKLPADAAYTTLTPRQAITSAPIAIRSLSAGTADSATNAINATSAVNAETLDGIDSTGFVPSNTTAFVRNQTAQQTANFNISGTGTVGGALTANTVTSTGTSNLIFVGQSSSNIGAWLRLNNTSAGGHNWNVISTGSGNGEGAGKLIFNDQTSGGTRLQIDGTGTTVSGNLTVSGTLNATVTTANFATLPHCKASQTSTQTFANGNIVTVRLDATQFCSGVTFDNANDQLVILTPGLYQVSAEILFLSNNVGLRFLAINTSLGELSGATTNAIGGFTTYLNTTGLVRLSAGNVVSLIAAQTAGGNLGSEVFNGRSASVSVNWVGP